MPETPRWLLLIHSLPPKPDYLRVKVRRRLQHIGAAPLKNSVYALPDTDEALEDFEWLRGEIEAEGGSAIICRTELLDGVTDEEVQAMLRGIDEDERDSAAAGVAERVEPGRTWVTREGVKVDRIASAWLIRRFIDPRAEYKFVAARGYRRQAGELRFDMYDAEYTHEGDRCTFETLLARFVLADPALRALGEIVHDIDCKDERFARPETAGVAALIRGIAEANDRDGDRLARGAEALDSLYLSLAHKRR